ncbi:hypothetical protein TBLA_0G02880 [Henningerozyma blattae CBS 6284]|uniref:Uncharacterized protein n=1 Tax=Henningerozyma blattae (strain ATCC 34711 / CBS 6284 / DSM 70876 / NBRC 10599 / NRRL Y-10934 / UCD 77-7) TaxID=1071380 RepID=I2H773_HENB6|nr:hypothetical protein TBLA_0G02880 [Tetrapisispora blattae CBS 6284]CCH62225.1 hypothetical protein TBLA_0G02880 [Tetrapisispora blattae CBS 6284]
MSGVRITKRMASKLPTTFKSIIYSNHNLEDCSSVLSLQNYQPKQNLSKSIVVRTLAFPINPSDINQLQGVYPSLPDKTYDYSTSEPSAIAGNEGVFEVISLPENKSSSFKIGDWVIPIRSNQGTWSNYRLFDRDNELVKVNGLDIYTAATVGVNGCTAYQLVNDYIKDWNPKENDWLVQNAGTSGVSKFVTQIAKAKGINSLSVIRDRDNFEEVAKTLEEKFGATKVISESQNYDKEFNKTILPKFLGPNPNIKLALNSVGGKSSGAIARKLQRDGLMLTYGGMSKQPVTLPTSLHIFKGLTSKGFWITDNVKRNPESKIEAVHEFVKLYTNGDIISPKDEIIPLTWDVKKFTDEQVLDLVKDGINSTGKKKLVVLNWD